MAQDKRQNQERLFYNFTVGHIVKACKIVQMQLKFTEACKFFVEGVHTTAKFIAG